MLRLTPPEVFQLAYGVDAKEIADALLPVTESVVIGPPAKSARSTPRANEISININNKSIKI